MLQDWLTWTRNATALQALVCPRSDIIGNLGGTLECRKWNSNNDTHLRLQVNYLLDTETTKCGAQNVWRKAKICKSGQKASNNEQVVTKRTSLGNTQHPWVFIVKGGNKHGRLYKKSEKDHSRSRCIHTTAGIHLEVDCALILQGQPPSSMKS